MSEDRRRIIQALHHKNHLTESLGNDALGMLKKKLAPGQFIEKVTREANSEDCLHCNGQPFCRLFLACAYLELEMLSMAKLFAEQAIAGFHMRGLNWNEALCHWLFGLILLQEGDNDPAKRSLQKALGILVKLLREFRSESNYKLAQQCDEHITQIEKTLRSVSKDARKNTALLNRPVADSDHVASYVEEATAKNAAYLAIPWIPVYTRVEVEASVSEPKWVEPEIKQKSELAEVFIDDICHRIHSVRQLDKQVTITKGKQYGWAKVHGQSMNDAKQTPIQEDDYVLFYESSWPDQNEIVIVSKTDSSFVEDSSSYMVKRYSKEQQELRSETSMKGGPYNPVKITEDYQCLGVVIAVAKPKP